MKLVTFWVLTSMYMDLNTLAPHQEIRVFSNESACIMAQRITPPKPIVTDKHLSFVMNSCRKEVVSFPFTK